MIVRKITHGWVIQKFDTHTGKFVSQEFVAGDECEYEDEDGETVDSELFESVDAEDGEEVYLSFDMVQPDTLES
jgi:hypothetical protein